MQPTGSTTSNMNSDAVDTRGMALGHGTYTNCSPTCTCIYVELSLLRLSSWGVLSSLSWVYWVQFIEFSLLSLTHIHSQSFANNYADWNTNKNEANIKQLNYRKAYIIKLNIIRLLDNIWNHTDNWHNSKFIQYKISR